MWLGDLLVAMYYGASSFALLLYREETYRKWMGIFTFCQ